MDSEVYCMDIPKDNSWFFNIVLGKSKEAIIYLEELAKTEQYACRYLKWLTEYFHKNQYQANFENNRTNIPVECLDLKNNIAQYLAMALMDDPIAVYGLSELVGPNAPSRFNICTLLFKSLKQRVIAMSHELTPMAIWDIQRAKWNGYQMKTVKPRSIVATIELHIPEKRYIRRICYDGLYFVEISCRKEADPASKFLGKISFPVCFKYKVYI
ncbi:MAG: hypothetical protein KIG23_00325, partial [Erysipelotrichaceae bacterium]|nr:hypothetical protein [Erysipelotrichaceae bacterium]